MNVYDSLWKIVLGLCVILVSILFLINGGDNPPPGYDVGGGVCNCTSCSDCTNAINDALCTTIQLTANITGEHNNCIDNPLGFNNKIFDCLGNTIDGDHGGWADWGIHLDGKQNNTIKNCIITDYPIGIILDSSVNNTIQNNNLSSNGGEEGLRLEVNSNLNNILNNVISDNVGDGIGIYDSVYNTVNNNTIFSNNNGIEVYTANNNTITYNTIYDNVIGINIIVLSLYNDVTNNNISSNLQDGIYLSATSISNLITLNLVCVNNQSGGAYYDINDLDSNTGDNNTCNTTSNWNDTGTTGCTFYCGESCINNITNTSWVNYANSSCYSNSTMDLNWSLIEYDVNDCGNVSNITYYMTNSTSCCTPNRVNTSWSVWGNVSCVGDEMNQSRNLIEYDNNSCGGSNVTYYEYQLVGPSYFNTSWESIANSSCLPNDTIQHNFSLIQYDIYACASNTTFYMTNYTSCDYCTPNLLNTSWVLISSGSCLENNTQLDYYELTEYDNNSCGEVANKTYNMSNYSTCSDCSCQTCDGCELDLNDNSCTTVNLTANITNQIGTCIDNPVNMSNKTLDCLGNIITGSGSDDGVYWESQDYNKIQNCIILNFSYGIAFYDSDYTTIVNNTVSNNTMYGVWLRKSSYSNITNNTVEYNTNFAGIYIYGTSPSNDNVLNDNRVCGNVNPDIKNTGDNSTGDNNICDTTSAWYDTGVASLIGCTWYCNGSCNTYYNYTPWVNITGVCLENNTVYQSRILYDLNGCEANVTEYQYASCVNCSATTCDGLELDLNDASCVDITLTTNINNYSGTCIDDPVNFTNKTLNCQGYTIDGDDNGTYYGVYSNTKSMNKIKNCVITDFGYAGVYLVSSSNYELNNNTLNSNIYGVRSTTDSNNNSFTNNTFNSNTNYGIYLILSLNNTLNNNTANSNDYNGIYLFTVLNSVLSNNNASSNGDYGIRLSASSNNNITNNTLNSNGEYGLYLDSSSDSNILKNNTISLNYNGIHLSSSSSSNTLNINNVCSNTNYDINIVSGSVNTGNNNTCRVTSNYNDVEIYLGCRYNCSNYDKYCKCGNCTVCEYYLNQSCSTVNLTNSITVNGSCLSSSKVNKNLNCGNYYVKGYNSSTGFNLNSVSNFNLTNCNLTNFTTGLLINNSNLTLINNTFCGNTKDISNTSSTVTSTNTYCRYTSNFTCDYFCSDMGYGFTYNWTIKNQSHWSSVNYNIPVWTCTAWETQCEPRGNSDYFSKQDMRRNKGIWNITSLNNCTIKTLEMSLNTTCSIEFRVSSYPNYWLSTNLSTSYTNIWNGTISTSKQLFAWADYSHPYSCDMGFLLKAGGYC